MNPDEKKVTAEEILANHHLIAVKTFKNRSSIYCHQETIDAMEEFAQHRSIEFAEWLFHLDNGTTHYNPFTKKETESIGFSPYDCVIDKTKTIDQLYKLFTSENK